MLINEIALRYLKVGYMPWLGAAFCHRVGPHQDDQRDVAHGADHTARHAHGDKQSHRVLSDGQGRDVACPYCPPFFAVYNLNGPNYSA